MAHAADYSGSLVAFEGPTEAISTQIRLLPTSPHILILPSIQNYLRPFTSADDDSLAFSASFFVRKVHDAATYRNETALSFLREPIANSKRLVFMNGGTPSAYALCIRAIAKHETGGDLDLAESKFGRLICRGLQDIDVEERVLRDRRQRSSHGDAYDGLDDPIARAMKAADALDRLTAALQPPSQMDQMSPRLRPRSLSLPLYGFADHFGDAMPFYVFGAAAPLQKEESADADEFGIDWCRLRAPLVSISGCEKEEARANAVQTPARFEIDHKIAENKTLGAGLRTLSRMPSCIGESYDQSGPRPTSILSSIGSDPRASPLSDVFDLPPVDHIICGKASLIDLPTTRYGRIKRTVSLDRVVPSSPTLKELCTIQPSIKDGFCGTWPVGQFFSALGIVDRRDVPLSPRLRRPPPPHKADDAPPPPPKSSRRPARLSYVDRGTDAIWTRDPGRSPSFQPVLPFVEDLVVYFKHDSPDPPLLQRVVQAFKAGKYPVTEQSRHLGRQPGALTASPGAGHHVEIPHTLVSLVPNRKCSSSTAHQDDDHVAHGTVAPLQLGAGEYDPFAYHQLPTTSAAVRPPKPLQLTKNASSTSTTTVLYNPTTTTAAPHATAFRLPTPTETPPPPSALTPDAEERFHDFNTAEHPTAIQTQNALRSVLNIYFPGDGGAAGSSGGAVSGYHQFVFPLLLPELGGLWAPIFSEAGPNGGSGGTQEATSSTLPPFYRHKRQHQQHQRRHVDLILAVGAQKGVKRGFFVGIVAQLEKLGAKPSGDTRSGRLDFRYLLANAMQAFTKLPLANQAHDNPFTNPYHLATLIVPALETYLAAHAQVRLLLLEFPPDHLPTILALQRLVGVDVVKVAQVVEPDDAKQPLPFNHLRGGSIGGGGTARAEGALSSALSGPTATSSYPASSASPTSASSSRAATANTSGPRPLPPPPPDNLSLSTANYLLTARASEAEIATFVSTIWQVLMDISPYYIPDGTPGKMSWSAGLSGAPPSLFSSVSMGDMRSSVASSCATTVRTARLLRLPLPLPPPPPRHSSKIASPSLASPFAGTAPKPFPSTTAAPVSSSSSSSSSSSQQQAPPPPPPPPASTRRARPSSTTSKKHKALLPNMFSPFPRVSSASSSTCGTPHSLPVSPKAARFLSTSSATAALANVTAAAAARGHYHYPHRGSSNAAAFSASPVSAFDDDDDDNDDDDMAAMSELDHHHHNALSPPPLHRVTTSTTVLRKNASTATLLPLRTRADDSPPPLARITTTAAAAATAATHRPSSARPCTASTLAADAESEWEVDLRREERRLMPLWTKHGVPPKGNSKKALKFLGLA